MPVTAAPNAALPSRIAARARFCRSMAMKQASTPRVQARIETASSRPIENGTTERIVCTMAPLCAMMALSVIAQAIGSSRGRLTLRSITQALAA